jgi:predicted ATPase
MIKNIDISNYKCFTIQRIHLNRITILAGANSAGKSSVIQSILLSRIAFERLQAVGYKVDNGIKIPLNGQYLLALGNTQEILNRESNRDDIGFSFLSTSNKSQNLNFVGDFVNDSNYELIISGWNGRPIETQYYSLFFDQFHYLNAERIGPRLKYEADSFPYPSVGWQGENTIQVLSERSINVDAERIFDKDAPPTVLSQARAWMEFIVPGVKIDDTNLFGKIKTAEVSFPMYCQSS